MKNTLRFNQFSVLILLSLLLISACTKDANERRDALVGSWSIEEHRVETVLSTGDLVSDTTRERTITFDDDGNFTLSTLGPFFVSGTTWVYQSYPEVVALFNVFGANPRGDVWPISFEVNDHTGNTWKFHGEKSGYIQLDTASNIADKTLILIDWKLSR